MAVHCGIVGKKEKQKKKTSRRKYPFQFFKFPNNCFGRKNLFLVVLLFASIFQSISCRVLAGPQVTPVDYQALQAFKHDLIDTSRILQSWNDTGYGACSGRWIGIKCFGEHVISIELPGKGLGGRISEKIGQFQALRKLSLHDNNIGGAIPSSLGSLHSLRGVSLFNNKLSGSIPPSLGLCPWLKTLDVSNNLLTGAIPSSLANSPKLYTLNLSFNSLTGSLPSAIANSSSLTLLALQYNSLSGSIPDNWGDTEDDRSYKLQILNLDHNCFSNSIPVSLSKLIRLEEISLSDNRIDGTIPVEIGRLSELQRLDLSQNRLTGGIPASLTNLTSLISFNVSHNELSGPVPFLLSKKFNSTSFVGNHQLCGYNVSTPCPSAPLWLGILLVVLPLLWCICWIASKAKTAAVTNGKKSAADTGGEVGEELVHFDGQLMFTGDDLCTKTDGVRQCTYGTTYKCTLEDGSEVIVRSLEKIAMNKREFAVEVTALGKIGHPNLLALRAYYLGPRGEKLLVFDFMPKGSLTSFFHARGPDTPVDWQTRMNITMGITRGLCYLHIEKNIVHGNLTSSNILLDDNTNAKIADYGLSQFMTTDANSNASAAAEVQGYHAPELSELNMANTKTDIYSLGVIILELLTGRQAENAMNGVDLPQWVASTVKEEWTDEVFDPELLRDASIISDELVSTLKLALHCVDRSPSARPEVQLVLQQLEEIKPKVAADATS